MDSITALELDVMDLEVSLEREEADLDLARRALRSVLENLRYLREEAPVVSLTETRAIVRQRTHLLALSQDGALRVCSLQARLRRKLQSLEAVHRYRDMLPPADRKVLRMEEHRTRREDD
jgi:hypothetical protein